MFLFGAEVVKADHCSNSNALGKRSDDQLERTWMPVSAGNEHKNNKTILYWEVTMQYGRSSNTSTLHSFTILLTYGTAELTERLPK